jgi:hypothetical protein
MYSKVVYLVLLKHGDVVCGSDGSVCGKSRRGRRIEEPRGQIVCGRCLMRLYGSRDGAGQQKRDRHRYREVLMLE